MGKEEIIFPTEEERLRYKLSSALECIRWTAQTIHQAYHLDSTGTFETCQKTICLHAAATIEGLI